MNPSRKQKDAAISYAVEQHGDGAILKPTPAGFRVVYHGAIPELVVDPPDAEVVVIEFETFEEGVG